MTEPLTLLRQQIDDIDDKILSLLFERIGIVRKVGEFKGKTAPGVCPIRPGREADMLRRVIAICAEGGFSPAAAASMWRTLIGASTTMESPLTISAFASGQDNDLYWLAREYFGSSIPITTQPHIKRVIGDVMDGKASVGIIPIIRSDDTSNWWTNLVQPGANAPKIFAHIPFVYHDAPGKNVPSAFAIARVTPEASSDDKSLVMLEVDHNVSQHRLQSLFAQAKLDARWINIAMLTPDSRHHLVEISGFITEEHAGLKSIESELGKTLMKSYILGAYGVPVTLQPKKENDHARASNA